MKSNMTQLNDWLSVDKASGTGDDTITLTALPNEGLDGRFLSIIVKTRWGKRSVDIRQTAKLEQEYFWVDFEDVGGVVNFKNLNLGLYVTLNFRYSFDGQNWNDVIDDKIELGENKRVYIYNDSRILHRTDNVNFGKKLSFSKSCRIGGNLIALSEMCYAAFNGTFKENTYLTDISNLIIPWDTLDSNCFESMFQGCTSLTKTPLTLPSTTLATSCYNNMFNGCTSLTKTPKLPATTLAEYCYYNMFTNCKNLTTAPKLPATILADYCYSLMFNGCSSLTTAPELPATALAEGCYDFMFYNCSSLTTAPKLPATTLANGCYSYMFYKCSSLAIAPKLPATNLAVECYNFMFNGCTSLTTAPTLPATNLAQACYNGMFYGCTSLVNAPKLHATTLANGCYGQMFKECSSLRYPPALPAENLAAQCYYSMFDGCTSLKYAPELPATTLVDSCYSSMFKNCTTLTSAPKLSALILEPYCYYGMFYGCTSLREITMLAFDISAEGCLGLWVYPSEDWDGDLNNWWGVGTFSKNSLADLEIGSYDGIPNGWNVINVEVESNTGGNIPEPITNDYFWVFLKGEGNGTISGFDKKFSYSYDGIEWNTAVSPLNVQKNTYVYFRKDSIYPFDNRINFSTYGDVGGDLSSLGDMKNYAFMELFIGNKYLQDASKLILPWDTLSANCYYAMFNDCISLTKAPELTATTLAESCYSNMFNGCVSLNYIKILATDISVNKCLYNWLRNASTTGTFVKKQGVTYPSGVSGIPNGWTIQEIP